VEIGYTDSRRDATFETLLHTQVAAYMNVSIDVIDELYLYSFITKYNPLTPGRWNS
jgi:hypothetical protein